jgi:hypothetical protein
MELRPDVLSLLKSISVHSPGATYYEISFRIMFSKSLKLNCSNILLSIELGIAISEIEMAYPSAISASV